MTSMEVRKKLTVSLSTWFCLPDKGMMDMEILCRASAFVVKSSSQGYKNKLHVVTASHNVAPWRFPKIYPEEWLQCINEKNTHYTIEIRHPDGMFMTQTELLPISYHHSSRDLAVLHLEADLVGLDTFTRLGYDHHNLSTRTLKSGENLMFEGFQIASSSTGNFGGNDGGDASTNDADIRLPVPSVIPGTFVSQEMYQQFARTYHKINHAMSGGPVISTPLKASSSATPATRGRTAVKVGAVPVDRGEVCGMLEGVVPEDSEDVENRGMVSFVDSDTILE